MKKIALFLLPWVCLAQGPARSVFVSSPKPRIISGEQVQLSALARDQNGAARSGDVFTWRSGNNGMATVDANGVVTAGRTLGLVDIFAVTAGNVQGSVRLQVLPLRIDVFPAVGELFVGDQFQYAAQAVDINGEVIPNIAFQWQTTGANGLGTQAATISGAGMLTARATARVTVRALINYGGVVGQFINPFVGISRLVIKPRNDFRLTRLLSSAELRHSFQLRPIPNRPMVVNDAGQIAFVGSLDGLATALLLYENGRIDVLASGGQPGPVAGGIITDFGAAAAINNRGQVLARVICQGTSGLALASRATGLTYIAVDGASAGGVDSLTNFSLTPSSLNDNGDALVLAQFQLAGQGRSGLFRIPSGGIPQRIATSGEALPGLPTAPTGFSFWGIDRDGDVYFQAVAGANRAIFRQQGFSQPVRVIGTGDALADSTISNIGATAVSSTGDLAFFYTLANGRNGLARITRGQSQFVALGGYRGTISVHGVAGVLFDGEAGQGWGLYRWTTGAPRPVLLEGRLAPNEEPLRQVMSATLNSRGDVFALVRTALTELVAIQPGAARPVLFQAGARIEAPAGLQLTNNSLVRGLGAGAPFLVLGSPASLFQLDARGLAPRLVLGDRIPNGAAFTGLSGPIEAVSGDLYADVFGHFTRRITPEAIEDFPVGSFRAEDGVNVGRGFLRAINARGQVVWEANTDRNHTRLYFAEGGRNILLATYSGEVRWQSPAPSGGTVSGRGDVAIDERGRVMINFRVTGGPSGWFLWENGRWRQTAVFPVPATGPSPTTSIRGQVISNAGNLRAVGDKFYAVFNLRAGGSVLAEFDSAEWAWIVGSQDVAPHGNLINNIGAYDVNQRGDIVYVANGAMLVFRSGGQDRLVHFNVETPEAGDFFSPQAVELREDGRIYFGGMNQLDQYELWLAEPLRTTLPSRSRRNAN